MRSMVNIISENHDQLHWVSGKESRSTDGKLASSKIWTTQSKSSTDTFYLYQITISIMIQNDGGKTSNTSELASSQEAIYVPYSKRHEIPDERFAHLCDYLERVIWVDMESQNILPHISFSKIEFTNNLFLLVDENSAHLASMPDFDWDIMRIIVKLPINVFWSNYQSIFSQIKDSFPIS